VLEANKKSIVLATQLWNRLSRTPMSEFKFACPVCGQHITADSSTGGAQIQCPTCFQKIVVPQPPVAGNTKLILSATQVTKPRPAGFDTHRDLGSRRRTPAVGSLGFIVLLAALLGSGAVLLLWAEDVLKIPVKPKIEVPTKVEYPVPSNTGWTMNATNTVVPEETVAGSVHGSGFKCERAILKGGMLSLRQGKTWPPDLGITVVLPAPEGELLSGKTILVGPRRPPPIPKIILRWKDENREQVTRDFTNGYVLKLVFGQPDHGRMPGKIYVGLPDDEKSFAAGTFDAEIRKPQVHPPDETQPAGNVSR
jgi:DNA-directed RNA polymerase subunit RPC12/RpoP